MAQSTNYTLDVPALADAIAAVARFKGGMTDRDIAAETGLSASTITRLHLHHRPPDADSLVTLLSWLGATNIFAKPRKRSKTTRPAQATLV